MGYPQTAKEKGHKHGEAFMLQWYHCSNCSHKERIWNSRDGITPFACGCPSCGEDMSHIEMYLDEYAPNHKLRIGQKFWRDGTPDEAQKIIESRIENFRDSYPISDEKKAELIADVRLNWLDGFNPWPELDVFMGDK